MSTPNAIKCWLASAADGTCMGVNTTPVTHAVEAMCFLALIAIVTWRIRVARRSLMALRADAERISIELFGQPLPPSIEVRYSYGYPSITVRFKSAERLNAAKSSGLTDQFIEKIQTRCKDAGSKKHPYDAARAVWFTI
jgi:hypothetical protein